MYKIFFKLHLWLSVPFGLIATVVCLSGAILVFEDEVTDAVCHNVVYVNDDDRENVPLSQMLATVDAGLPADVSITGVTVSADRSRAVEVHLSRPRRAALYVDPADGTVTGEKQTLPFFKFVHNLHRWLLDERTDDVPYPLGRRIVGFTVLAFLLILITGLVIWWPRNAKVLHNRLRIALSSGWRRFWYDLHVAGGFYSFLLLAVLALTGLTWSFPVYRTFIYSTFGDAEEQKFDLAGGYDRQTEEHPFGVWESVYLELHKANEGRDITVSHGEASVAGKGWGNAYASDTYLFDEKSGKMLSTVMYDDKGCSEKIKGWILTLHLGKWGGWFGKLVTAIVALLGASLPVTGYYLWLRKYFRKKRAA